MQVSLSAPCLSMIPWQTGSIHFFPSFYKHWLGTYYASGIIPSAGHTIWNKTKFLFSWRLHSVGVTSQRVKVSRFPAPGHNDPKYISDPAKKPHFFVCIQYMGLGVNNGQFCPPNHTPVSTRSPPVTLQNMRTLSEWGHFRTWGPYLNGWNGDAVGARVHSWWKLGEELERELPHSSISLLPCVHPTASKDLDRILAYRLKLLVQVSITLRETLNRTKTRVWVSGATLRQRERGAAAEARWERKLWWKHGARMEMSPCVF